MKLLDQRVGALVDAGLGRTQRSERRYEVHQIRILLRHVCFQQAAVAAVIDFHGIGNRAAECTLSAADGLHAVIQIARRSKCMNCPTSSLVFSAPVNVNFTRSVFGPACQHGQRSIFCLPGMTVNARCS